MGWLCGVGVGKDLSRIPIPVNFSEPLSMLQRLTEDFEYRWETTGIYFTTSTSSVVHPAVLRIRIILIRIRIQPFFYTDPDPGKWYGFHGSGSGSLASRSGSGSLASRSVFLMVRIRIHTIQNRGKRLDWQTKIHHLILNWELSSFAINRYNLF